MRRGGQRAIYSDIIIRVIKREDQGDMRVYDRHRLSGRARVRRDYRNRQRGITSRSRRVFCLSFADINMPVQAFDSNKLPSQKLQFPFVCLYERRAYIRVSVGAFKRSGPTLYTVRCA